ncbi:alpha-L-fucosidase, partial [Streptococcus pneumoniae]|uniref:alpha-L-fucosidase n=1 Tax=Streptococcus pneumoniae TaxID=1313 RepID=UPI00345324F5
MVTSMLYSTLFIPATAMTFPVYRLVNELGIYNTPVALILVYSCSGIAMSFFIIKNYFEIIPKELETQWFREARFGMFIHWGLYSIPGKGEWIRSHQKLSIED